MGPSLSSEGGCVAEARPSDKSAPLLMRRAAAVAQRTHWENRKSDTSPHLIGRLVKMMMMMMMLKFSVCDFGYNEKKL